MPKMFLLTRTILVVLATVHTATGKALDSNNCLGLSGRTTDCGTDHYCSNSLLDKGCRHCRDIADHYCHNNTKIEADFPSCRDYCQRRQTEELVADMNETLKNLSSENSYLSQALKDNTQALHTAQGTQDKLKVALIIVTAAALIFLSLQARCLWKAKNDYKRLLIKYPHSFTACETTESAWWMCCVFRSSLNVPIAVEDPETPTATFINSNSADNLPDSGLHSLDSVDINLGAITTNYEAMNET